jgi:hypothetical protein
MAAATGSQQGCVLRASSLLHASQVQQQLTLGLDPSV